MKFLHSGSRVEALSDGVFAFAATLLAVSMENDKTHSSLAINFVGFTSFTISFFVLILLWKAHYNFFRRTNYMDNWIITFNSIFLFAILYFIFPLKSLLFSMLKQFKVSANDLSILFEQYGSAIAILFVSLSLMYYRAYKKDVTNSSRLKLLFYTRHYGIFIVVSIISILLSYFQIGMRIGFPGMFYSILGILCAWHGAKFSHYLKK